MKKNNSVNRITNGIINVLAWLVFIFSVLVAIVTVVAFANNPNEDKPIFGYQFYTVQSDSMRLPKNKSEDVFFNAGDVIIVRAVDNPYNLKEGDVITFVSDSSESFGKTVTHKIREVKRNSVGKTLGYVTYGIYTGEVDSALVRPDNVKGVYCAKLPSIGWLVDFLKQPTGYFMCILFPFVLLIIHLSIKVGMMISGPRTAIRRPTATPRANTLNICVLRVQPRKRPRIVLRKHKN